MLPRSLAISQYDRGRVYPDRLTRRRHARYALHAERMLRVYRTGVGRTRQELHRAVQDVLAGEPDCPLRRIGAFAKLLDDASRYERERRGGAARLRQSVFRLAAGMHPLVRCPDRQFPHEEGRAKAAIAAQLGRSWSDIDRSVFADIKEFHRLESFEGYADGPALLARYNIAQIQAALFDAVSMTVWADTDFKVILRYAKLAGLMHTIRAAGGGRYEFRFDGPASVLRVTRRYGVAMARFLPALVACRGWRLHAVVRTRRQGWNVALDLSPDDGLTSHLPAPEEFDSCVEEDFAQAWGTKRDGWTLVREGQVLHHGQKVFLPDFAFQHDDGRRMLLEIVGFWTPQYLEAKLKTLKAFSNHRVLLALGPSATRQHGDWPGDAIRYKRRLRVEDVLESLRTQREKKTTTNSLARPLAAIELPCRLDRQELRASGEASDHLRPLPACPASEAG